MRRVLIRPAADSDLEHQAGYITAASGIDAALRFYASVEETLRMLAAAPDLGRTSPHRNSALRNTRMLRVKGFRHHLIFYRRVHSGIEVIRVLHGARDIENLFE